MKLVLSSDVALVGEMREAMETAKKLDQEIAYFDLSAEEYAQLKQALYWPGEAGEVPHFWNVELRVDGVPTWYIQKQKGKPADNPAGGVASLFGRTPDPTKH